MLCSVGMGLAKTEAAAKRMRSVSDHHLRRIAAMLLTEGQEGSKDADELHCSCYREGLLEKK